MCLDDIKVYILCNYIITMSTSTENFDFNISNYTLPDIYKLFKISYPSSLTKDVLSDAKRTVLQIHPDKYWHLHKKRIPKEYFLFYSKAYKVLYNVYQAVSNDENAPKDSTKSRNQYYNDTGKYQTDDVNTGIVSPNKLTTILSDIRNKRDTTYNSNEFDDINKLVNSMYEAVYFKDNTHENGYGEWFKSDEACDNPQSPGNISNRLELHDFIERKKREKRELVKYDGNYNGLGSGNHAGMYDLNRDVPVSYSSGVFSKLQYEDLKKAHTETVIPVCEEDELDRITAQVSVDKYKIGRERERHNYRVLPKEESMKILEDKQEQEDIQASLIAHKLMKESEDAKKSVVSWLNKFDTLEW
jgi:hypothetical protein